MQVRLNYTKGNPSQEEIDWLKDAEKKLNNEYDRCLFDLMTYGTCVMEDGSHINLRDYISEASTT